ncbi:MAG: isoprenyl transferase [Actinobacteria bacterium]|nr:isoprenyl transferase [Actinomycetota bacterium]MTA98323.1 isoprenyl transferase [Actinomycetota bacterium]
MNLHLKPAIKSLLYPLYERRLIAQLDYSQTPHHVGVILDGNRRWAKANPDEAGDTSTKRGHQAGAKKIVDLLDWCEEAQVAVVTLWLLSNDNLARPANELNPLLEIIGDALEELGEIGRWELRPVGSMELLPNWLQEKLNAVATKSKGIPGVLVNVAIGYGGRQEIADAVKSLIADAVKHGKQVDELAGLISESEISKFLYTAGLPDPDLVIRTSGEQRLGGFLLWQSAKSEFYFCEAYWPDFRKVDFLRALRSYSQRHRRLGL